MLRARSLEALANPETAAVCSWQRPGHLDPATAPVGRMQEICENVRASWTGRFHFRQENQEAGTPGLRSPQVGALHNTLGHWTVSDAPATVVMPTGTGKTETMLALLVNQRFPRLLVMVPTVTLRDQLSLKFLTLGVLKRHGIVDDEALYPVVGILQHRPKSVEEVDALFERCNVIVTNMHAAGGCPPFLQERMIERCSHLFIDEAHHVPAKTWEAFRRRMLSKIIVQFTATPFRTDGRLVEGKVIFNYPLRKAQDEGYFRPIVFRPVNVFTQADADFEIACAAIAQLDEDRAKGLSHIVMARVDGVARAETVHGIYRDLAPEHEPLLLHYDLPVSVRREAVAKLRAGESRMIVCVDMLGEGFDLPELKIAAMHDMHKSLAITLQFTGRFTRTAPNIGGATVIANIADPKVEESLRGLYAEDADWNLLLQRLSEGATGRQQKRSELLDSFQDAPPELPLRNIAPKMSAVVYKTTCASWTPEEIDIETRWVSLHSNPAVSRAFNMAIFVTREIDPVPWGEVKEVMNVSWHLYMLHWNRELGLLFINSSNNDGAHEGLAKSVAGEDVELIRGEQIFRSLHGINRLILMNLGLSHSLSRAVRFTMLVGADIGESITDGQLETKTKSNTFGKGYAQGGKVTVGCSKKGRVWSYKVAYDVSEWIEWCADVGRKLIDPSIVPSDIFLHNVLLPKRITQRPALVPITIEWSEDFYRRPEDTVMIDINGEVAPFFEVGLELVDHEREGPIRFRVFTETKSATYAIHFSENAVRFEPASGLPVMIKVGKRTKTLAEWFDEEPPVLRFEDNTFVIYNEIFRVRPGPDRVPFAREKIDAWAWPAQVDIKVESQKVPKRANSIQHHVIQRLLLPGNGTQYDFVLDDDDHHESADVVGLKVVKDTLVVHFFHCKYSKEAKPGSRIEDLYAVCGQAQKSVSWKADPEELIRHLRLRSDARRRKMGVSRFEKGDEAGLTALGHKVRFLIPEFRIFIVQPGLSKAEASLGQLDLLAATEAYLKETYAIPLTVVASP